MLWLFWGVGCSRVTPTEPDPPTPTPPSVVALAPLSLTLVAPEIPSPIELLLLPLADGGLALAPADDDARHTVAVDVLDRRADAVSLALALAPVSLQLGTAPGPVARLQADTFTFELVDEDADGRVERGVAHATGQVLVVGAEGRFYDLDHGFTVDVDIRPGSLRIVASTPLLPTDAARVALSEPGVGPGAPGVTLDGDEVGVVEPWRGGLVVEIGVAGPRALPWGATLAVDAGGLRDTSGNPFASGPAREVHPDPGPWDENAGFEADGGWAVRGGAFELPPEGLAAPEGERAACLPHGGVLVGEIPVPAGATTLSLSLGAVATFWDSATRARVRLRTPNGEELLFDPRGDAGEACDDCGGFGWRHPWTRVEADVSPWQGRSVWVLAELDLAPYLFLPQGVLCVDDARLD